MLFCQLFGRQSLRDLEDSFNANNAHHYHLGTLVIRSPSLSDTQEIKEYVIPLIRQYTLHIVPLKELSSLVIPIEKRCHYGQKVAVD